MRENEPSLRAIKNERDPILRYGSHLRDYFDARHELLPNPDQLLFRLELSDLTRRINAPCQFLPNLTKPVSSSTGIPLQHAQEVPRAPISKRKPLPTQPAKKTRHKGANAKNG